jgi:glycosyltransferase involved in cell wall biosynthesis
MGIEVAVFAPQEGRSTTVGDHGPTPRLSQPVTHDPKAWEDAFGSSVTMWTGDATQAIEDRWSEMLKLLDGFRPDAVLVFGVITPLHWMLWPRYPLAALPGIGVPPLGPADVWLCSRPQDVPAAHETDPRHPLPVRYAARSFAPTPSTSVRQRSELGLGLRATVLLTVGTALSTEIDGPWAQAMVALLQRHPQVHWLLVGEAKVPPALAAVSQRLRVLPYQKDLAALMPLADVYVNPPRPGGGVSVAMAMALGLPALAFAGTDGGDKLGDMASPDQETYLSTLDRMVLLADERTEWARRARLRFATDLDLDCAQPALQQALDTAVARFNRRR